MAVETVDFNVRPEDGWTKIATNPTLLIIRPTDYRPWWLAVTDSGAPGDDIIGLQYGRGGDNSRETVLFDASLTGEVYIRIKDPPASYASSRAHFGVVRDEAA